MEFSELVSKESVVTDIEDVQKRDVLLHLSEIASKASGVSEKSIYEILIERESLGTTGVGHGVAIPHGKIDGLDKIYGVLATTKNPVDFESADGQSVDIMFLLLTPSGAGADHLKALAKVSKTLRDTGICDEMRKAKNSKDLYNLLVAQDA
jgi:PTS system nitrogen regulatory IIA component